MVKGCAQDHDGVNNNCYLHSRSNICSPYDLCNRNN